MLAAAHAEKAEEQAHDKQSSVKETDATVSAQPDEYKGARPPSPPSSPAAVAATPLPTPQLPHGAVQSPYPQGEPATVAPPAQGLKQWLIGAGRTVLQGMEFVGEVVASVLGIDEAKYQDIYDSMTEEELAEARRVNDIRNAEYEAWAAAHPEAFLESDDDREAPNALTSIMGSLNTVGGAGTTLDAGSERSSDVPPVEPGARNSENIAEEV